ncbi:ABC-type sugar transport system substrate-binding protein [Nocardioides aromaticivorans]|jgi:hypothetical protein|uniref:ABC-type sugar transport system substrate-binding protein n=1 Tax=Nocardioides aromaticivorans TaxID=200618 RepID=A0A7Z0CKB0_9ACTN|nr:hypothetical protein [Nocardioides aromaticivorans]NYI44551.1 ABC-type sugar transport system substrate-binding protein [Nocardioides aromaticivorans]HVK29285.1 hypothetical protein [Nocardioides sp.]
MKKAARRFALATVALIASLGVVSLPSAADADTGWPSRVVVRHYDR